MDLNDLWQGHKKFILGVGVALAAILIGKAVIGMAWDAKTASGAARSFETKLKKLGAPPQVVVTELRAENERLRESLEQLVQQTAFATRPDFVLDPNDRSPELTYDATRARAVEDLVDVARRRNIRIDESLGLPDFTPQGREAIQRALRALDIVGQVVEAAIVSDVRSIDEIEVIEARTARARKDETTFLEPLSVRFKISGSTAAIAELVESLVRGERGRYLSVDEARIEIDDAKGLGLTTLQCTVSGLLIGSAGSGSDDAAEPEGSA